MDRKSGKSKGLRNFGWALQHRLDGDGYDEAPLFTARLVGAEWEPWEIWLRIGPDSRIQSFEVKPVNDGAEYPRADLTTAMLRAIPLGDLRNRALERMRDLRRDEDPRRAFLHPQKVEFLQTWTRPGRRGRPDIEYALVAQQYVALLGKADLLESLATQLRVAAPTARNLVHEARRRDLLTRVGQGRAGGELTETAIRLLERAGYGTR